MDNAKVLEFTHRIWDESIVPTLCDYVRIPNKSPNFDPDWDSHGYMDQAAELMADWCRKQPVKGMQVEIVRLEGRTPLLFIEIDGDNDDTVLLYGHLDKQPEFDGWSDGLTPWEPVIRDGKLYGRGGADDGYAVFGSLAAIRALQEQGLPHARCVVLIEGCEESGSFDLPYYIDHLEARIGTPSLVVCLDAECGNYEQLWTTTSLRGNLVGTLKAAVLKEGVHSGGASGIVPSSFRVLRLLLDRLEDPETGASRVPELEGNVPAARLEQARAAAAVLGDNVHQRFPWAGGTRPVAQEPVELILNNTWRPTLSVTGAAGMPTPGAAGNTLRPWTSLKLSFRLPPTADPARAAAAVKKVLETDPPLGAEVEFDVESSMGGWNAPPVAPWLEASMQAASEAFFGKPALYMGTGGSIPFMGMLGEKFPGVQFLVTGVLGPNSNAHGPNEFLHIETGKRITACVARVLADHYRRADVAQAA
ncbi:M20 family metallopeptidase [Thioalkalivibrio sp. XN279]|uniref:M20 family metallopeptidase n=1 Tax=Thioalkalivibrio sp. XN279 TaxID=2714953 RepID=UPI00140A10C7|nr:M20 family metallopeptidase [Thioalkalivibrio sp. XN279]NHA14381.1 M20/M25/M40 family metallo-hydrolase [Thioalkalivibrio sp. XN279]